MNTKYEFHLMQLADSFFPSGAFGASGGLESFVKAGRVKDRQGVLDFIRQQLRFQLVPCDCPIFLAAMDAASREDLSTVVTADNHYYSMKLVKEVRTWSIRSGRQLLNSIVNISPNKFAKRFHHKVLHGKSPGTQPVCLAIAAHSLGIPEKSALRMMLYTYSVSIVGSAVRLGVIHHVEAQQILKDLAIDIEKVNPRIGIEQIWQLSPLVDILQMQHERNELRMFIT